MPPSATASSIGEGGQPAGKVDLVTVAAESTLNALSFILAKRKRDDVVGPSGSMKSKDSMSLHALKQATGLMPTAGHPSTA